MKLSIALRHFASRFSRGAEEESLLSQLKEAIAGSEKDFTNVPLGKAVLLLSIPMILEMIMESVFAVVDIYFVSKIGPGAVAAVGITESMLTIVYSAAMGLSTATTALVSRRIGEKDSRGASQTAVQGILVGIAISVPVTILGLFFAKDLLGLMGTEEKVIADSYLYTTIMLGGNVVIMLLFIINAIFRSSGDAAVSMRVLWLANAINIVLDPCLIFGLGPFPEMGIVGAAVATTIGRGTAVAYQLYILFSGKKRVAVSWSDLKLRLQVMRKLLRLALGGIGQSLIATSSWIGMVRIVSVFGSEVLAGYTIAIRIVIFSILPSWGISNAAATLVGQNLGAGKPERAERSVWITGGINTLVLGAIGVFFIATPHTFVDVFSDNPQVVASAVVCLRYIAFGYLTYGFAMVLVQSFNGAGDTTTPTIINFFCFWLLEIPLAYLLAIPMSQTERGVCLAIVVAETVMMIAGVILFRRGKWKQQSV